MDLAVREKRVQESRQLAGSAAALARACPRAEIVGDTPAAQCRIAEAGDYTYIEQNTGKKSPWTRLARQGHRIWWEFNKRGRKSYTGRLIIDGELYTVAEAKKKFNVR